MVNWDEHPKGMAEMIEFKYEDEIEAANASVAVTTTCEGAASVVEAFKTFLRLAGYHPDTVARVVLLDDDRQETPTRGDGNPRQGDGNPRQGDFFDSPPYGGDADEHGHGGI